MLVGRSLSAYWVFSCGLPADDLDVDRRRQAEVEDLAGDVGRQEGEGRAGIEARQLLAQRVDVADGLCGANSSCMEISTSVSMTPIVPELP